MPLEKLIESELNLAGSTEDEVQKQNIIKFIAHFIRPRSSLNDADIIKVLVLWPLNELAHLSPFCEQYLDNIIIHRYDYRSALGNHHDEGISLIQYKPYLYLHAVKVLDKARVNGCFMSLFDKLSVRHFQNAFADDFMGGLRCLETLSTMTEQQREAILNELKHFHSQLLHEDLNLLINAMKNISPHTLHDKIQSACLMASTDVGHLYPLTFLIQLHSVYDQDTLTKILVRYSQAQAKLLNAQTLDLKKLPLIAKIIETIPQVIIESDLFDFRALINQLQHYDPSQLKSLIPLRPLLPTFIELNLLAKWFLPLMIIAKEQTSTFVNALCKLVTHCHDELAILARIQQYPANLFYQHLPSFIHIVTSLHPDFKADWLIDVLCQIKKSKQLAMIERQPHFFFNLYYLSHSLTRALYYIEEGIDEKRAYDHYLKVDKLKAHAMTRQSSKEDRINIKAIIVNAVHQVLDLDKLAAILTLTHELSAFVRGTEIITHHHAPYTNAHYIANLIQCLNQLPRESLDALRNQRNTRVLPYFINSFCQQVSPTFCAKAILGLGIDKAYDLNTLLLNRLKRLKAPSQAALLSAVERMPLSHLIVLLNHEPLFKISRQSDFCDKLSSLSLIEGESQLKHNPRRQIQFFKEAEVPSRPSSQHFGTKLTP